MYGAFRVQEILVFLLQWGISPSGLGRPHYLGFAIRLAHTTLGGIPLDECSVRHEDLYRTAHDTQKIQTSLPAAVFKYAVPASERLNSYAVDNRGQLERRRLVWGHGFYRCCVFSGETKRAQRNFEQSEVYTSP